MSDECENTLEPVGLVRELEGPEPTELEGDPAATLDDLFADHTLECF